MADPIPLITIQQLDQSESIYQGTDTDGRLLFRELLPPTTDSNTHKLALVALGLIEVCHRHGYGKVLFNPIPHVMTRRNARIATTRGGGDFVKEAVWAFHRLPNLIYVPFIWGRRDKAIWTEMTHASRYLLSNSRNGILSRRASVMPIDLTLDLTERGTFRLNGYCDEYSGYKANLAIVPKAFVGWASDLRRNAGALQVGGSDMNDPAGAWYTVNEEMLADHQVIKADQIVEKLRSMYFTRVSRLVVEFGTVLEDIIELKHSLAVAESFVKEKTVKV